MMSPHEIGRVAGRIFKISLPKNCVERDQENKEDYGIDFELEVIAPGEQATGFVFKAQVKGVEAAQVSAGNQTLPFSIPVRKMRYYLRQLNVPVVLVVVDVATSTTYWARLQGNSGVETAFAQAESATPVQQTMTIHLPLRQTLPATFHEMHQAAIDSQNAITLANLRFTYTQALIGSDTINFEANAETIALHHDFFRSESLEREIQEGNPIQVYQKYRRIFESGAESFPMRLSAALNLIRLYPATLRQETVGRLAQIHHERLEVCRVLYQVAIPEKLHKNLRILSLAVLRSAQLKITVEREVEMRIVLSLTPFALESEKMAYAAIQASTAMSVARKFRKVQCTFLRLFKLEAYGLLPYLWRQIASDITPFLMSFGAGETLEIRNQIVEWLDSTYENTMLIAQHTKDWASVGVLAVTGVQYASAVSENVYQKRIDEARSTINGIEDPAVKSHWIGRLDMLQSMLSGQHPI